MKNSSVAQHRKKVITLILISSVIVIDAAAQNGVGINIPNPLEMLDVNGAIRIGSDFNNSTTAPQGGAGTIRWTGSSFEGWDGTQWIAFGAGGSSNLLEDADQDTKVQVEESADEDKIRFDTQGSERMVIQSDGNIGIGQSAPMWPLTIRDDDNIFSATDVIDPLKFAVNVVKGTSGNNEGVGIGLGSSGNGSQAGAGIVFKKTGNNSLGDLMLTVKSNYSTNGPQAPALTIKSISGNVGIGTTNPSDELEVTGNIRMVDGNQAVGYIPVSDANGTMVWTDPASISTATLNEMVDADSDTKIQVEESADEDKIRFDTGGNERMIIDNAGNIGIGNSAPTAKLDITGVLKASGGATFGNNVVASGNYYLENTSGTGSNNPDFRVDGYANKLYIIAESGSTGPATGTEIRFRTASGSSGAGDKVVIDKDGNVGIGTTAPQEKLHVSGSVRMVDGNQSSGFIPVSDANGTMTWTNPASITTAADGDGDSSNEFQAIAISGNDITLSDGGGTVTVPFQTIIVDADSDTKIQVEETADEDKIRFDAGGSERMIIDNSGNVGVGTLVPQEKLHVDGSIRMVDGNQAAGFVPVSDANGSMVWTDPTTITTATMDKIVDADNDTRVEVEASADEDKVRIYCKGKQVAVFEGNAYGYPRMAMGQSYQSVQENVVIGTGAGNLLSYGDRYTCTIGYKSGTTVGSNNNNNSFYGAYSGYQTGGVANNTYIGAYAGHSATGGSNVFLGYQAGYNETASNRLYIDNSSTTSPLIYGEFNNNLLRINGEIEITGASQFGGIINTENNWISGDGGSLGLLVEDDGSVKFSSRINTNNQWISGDDNADEGLMIEDDGSVKFSSRINTNNQWITGDDTANEGLMIEDDGSVKFSSRINTNNQWITGDDNANEGMYIDDNGRVNVKSSINGNEQFVMIIENTANSNSSRDEGLEIIAGHASYNSSQESSFIQFTSPDNDYCGRIRQSGNNAVEYISASDERLKENIRPSKYGLNDLMKIEVVDYNYKTDKAEDVQTGYLAQQLYTAFPHPVDVGGEDPKTQPWGVDYGAVSPLLVKAMQELAKQNEQQQIIIDQLLKEKLEMENRFSSLSADVEDLKALLNVDSEATNR